MNLQQTIQQAKALGYSSVQTAAGAIPLDEWTPYGKTEHPHISFNISGNTVTETPIDPPYQGMACGIWELGTAYTRTIDPMTEDLAAIEINTKIEKGENLTPREQEYLDGIMHEINLCF